MNNFCRKVAVVFVCTALGFALGANKEAKAVTLTLAPMTTFTVLDGNPDVVEDWGAFKFDGLGDRVLSDGFGNFSGSFTTVHSSPKYEKGGYELAVFAEFSIGNFSAVPNTFINSAIFQAEINRMSVFEFANPGSLGIFGYVGNGSFEASDFEAGAFLSSVNVSSSSAGDIMNFDVTSFVNQRVSKGDTIAGFSIRVMNSGHLYLGGGSLDGMQPRLIVKTADVTEPVPEPTTILSAAIALGWGGWLKRKNSIK